MNAELKAAKNMDWQQVVLNGGPPCFHLEEDGSFCGRAERWQGHRVKDFHVFKSLANLIESQQKEVYEFRLSVDILSKQVESQQKEIDKKIKAYATLLFAYGNAQKENEELRRDKERLDWVQNNAIELCTSNTGQWSALQPMFPEPSELVGKGNSIRQAIDAAMQESKPNQSEH